jgi:phosphonate transport system permease protein
MAPVATARPGRAWMLWVGGGFVALLVWSADGTRVDLVSLGSGEALRQITLYVAKLFPPDLSRATLREAGLGAVETFAISLIGSLFAVMIALPLALLATRTLLYRGILFEARPPGLGVRAGRMVLYGLGKGTLNLLRTIPEIVWALIFVFMVGLGPFPGVLALGVHTGGVLGKLFGEVLEDVDPAPLEALQATGASRFTILVYGVLPQALPQFVSYALYRWEVNIRAAAMMGFVGAGGLGQRIYVAISLFDEQGLMTLILAIYLIVTLVDALSAYLRARLV